MAAKSKAAVCFQDVWKAFEREQQHDAAETDGSTSPEVVSDVFFELANAPVVSYRLPPPLTPSTTATTTPMDASDAVDVPVVVTIEQDVSGAAQKHTGGIVWETAYLLLNYLLYNGFDFDGDHGDMDDFDGGGDMIPLGRARTVLELGAGCGMLGLAIYGRALQRTMKTMTTAPGTKGAAPFRVIVTETGLVMDNLRRNVDRNYPSHRHHDDDGDVSKPRRKRLASSTAQSVPITGLCPQLSVCELDWMSPEGDCERAGIDPHSVDVLLGTDVVFSTTLVKPLLQTMEYLSHAGTVAYLCLQERCKDSHGLLLGGAAHHGFHIDDISDRVFDTIQSCRFGKDLDCTILKFTRLPMGDRLGSGDGERQTLARTKRKRKRFQGVRRGMGRSL